MTASTASETLLVLLSGAAFAGPSLRVRCGKAWRTGWLCVVMAYNLLQAGQAQTAREIPRGVFSLEKEGVPTNPRVLADPAVDGISIRQRWRELEKSKGAYDWSFLDAEVARAEKAGKAVLIRILSEGQSTPEWVYDEGVQTFAFQDENPYHTEKGGKFAIFWDKTFLSEKKAMIEAAGAHLAGNQAVRIVATICASARSDDWLVPHNPADIGHWQAEGYTSGKMVDVCKQIIDVTMQSFPRQCVTLAAGRNGTLDPDPDYVVRHAVEYARSRYPGRFIVQKNSLSAVSPLPGQGDFFQILWDSRPDIAGQMLWSSYDDPNCRNNGGRHPCDPEVTLRQAIDIGLRYGMKYIEVYQRDVINLPEVIRYAHNSLTK
jgi:Beta-galactosidase